MKKLEQQIYNARVKKDKALSIFENAQNQLSESNRILAETKYQIDENIKLLNDQIKMYDSMHKGLSEELESNIKIINNIDKVLDNE
jgi:hypothetical protein